MPPCLAALCGVCCGGFGHIVPDAICVFQSIGLHRKAQLVAIDLLNEATSLDHKERLLSVCPFRCFQTKISCLA